MVYCKTCNIYCPSDYQMQEHLSGRKHALCLRGIDSSSNSSTSGLVKGVCFQFQKTGRCSKGSLCTYKHIGSSAVSSSCDSPTTTSESSYFDESYDNTGFTKNSNLISPPPVSQNKRSRADQASVISCQFYICKTSDPDLQEDSDTTKQVKLAPIFCQPVKKETKKQPNEGRQFPPEYQNLFHRKRDVNLFIQNGLVVWEFAYNARVIQAIKENIKGRAWNPKIGRKGCWTCPLESLPDAIALYEYMGRTASSELKKRANEIQQKFGGSSASDAIKLNVEISIDKLRDGATVETEEEESSPSTFGSVTVTFLYDADIVQSLRVLAPTQRTYDPISKAWKIDFLVLPIFLENLLPLGYNGSKCLRTLASLAKDVNDLMFGQSEMLQDKVKNEKGTISSDIEAENNIIIVVDDSDDENGVTNAPKPEEKVKIEHSNIAESQAYALEVKLKAIIDLVASNGENSTSLDLSDCGSAKRTKISIAQKMWVSEHYGVGDDDSIDTYFDDSSDEEDGYKSLIYSKGAFSAFARKAFNKLRCTNSDASNIPDDCDCGNPHKMSGGKHICRYFGTFECSCGNRWTSAYCWKGEMQACRSCNTEHFPIRKEKLDGSAGRGGLGAHDSANCGRCRSLGFSCTGSFGSFF